MLTVDIDTLIKSLPWYGLREAIEYGISEAEVLGKDLLGLTLDNGDGLILYINPYNANIYQLFVISKTKHNLRLMGNFTRFDGNTFFIYEIDNPSELINTFGTNVRVEYVEVIKDVLEDFLHQAMDR